MTSALLIQVLAACAISPSTRSRSTSPSCTACTSDHAFAIIEAVAGLAARLDMVTTAEGVETEDQLAWVRALGVTEVQGFHISPPVPFAEIARLLAEDKGGQAAA
jgi:EAL domain-containing protein (putative c-di-GMP-specific phosphodiesterase class I)